MRKPTPMASMAVAGRVFQPRPASSAARGVRPPSSPPRTLERVERTVRGEGERSERSPRPVRHDLPLVLAAGAAAALVASSLVLLGALRVHQVQAGYRVHDLRMEVVRLRHERATLEVERSALLRPARLAELARTGLELVPVDATRVLPEEARPGAAASGRVMTPGSVP